MVKITFVEQNGNTFEVNAPEGETVMRAALDNGVPGIIADCGGECSCATCHAYLDETFFALADAPSEEETDMLECAIEVRPTSRLTCQVILDKSMDGMTVAVPASQL